MRTVFLALTAVLIAVLLAPQTALAAPECSVLNPTTGECIIEIEIPGTPVTPGDPPPAQGGGGSGGGGGGGQGSPAPAACVDDAFYPVPTPVDCARDGGYWSNDRDCYVAVADPQPPADDPIRGGNTGGLVYRCTYSVAIGGTGATYFWSDVAPEGPAAPPDPAVLAQQAVDAMGLQAIEIGIVPEATPGSMGLVGLPTWMWVDQPSENTYGPISRTVAAGGVSVTATAEVNSIVWSMGDGRSVTCTTAGTPYADSYGRQSSPDCGHTYTRTSAGQPGGAYTVAATSSWTITWAGGGQTGTIDDISFTQQAQVQIGELQVIQTR
jgi:hypothetical protein